MIKKNPRVGFLPRNSRMQKTVYPKIKNCLCSFLFPCIYGWERNIKISTKLDRYVTTKPDSTKTVWSRAICEQFFTCCGLDNRKLIDNKGKGASRLVRE
jgi:hypothetical protein